MNANPNSNMWMKYSYRQTAHVKSPYQRSSSRNSYTCSWNSRMPRHQLEIPVKFMYQLDIGPEIQLYARNSCEIRLCLGTWSISGLKFICKLEIPVKFLWNSCTRSKFLWNSCEIPAPARNSCEIPTPARYRPWNSYIRSKSPEKTSFASTIMNNLTVLMN